MDRLFDAPKLWSLTLLVLCVAGSSQTVVATDDLRRASQRNRDVSSYLF
jgi:hypothetical protein